MSEFMQNHFESEGSHDPDTELLFYGIMQKGIGEIAISGEWYFTSPKPGFRPSYHARANFGPRN